jgi:hypothetical protein
VRVRGWLRGPSQADLRLAFREAVALLGGDGRDASPGQARSLRPRWLILDRLALRAYHLGLPDSGPGAVVVERGCPACGADATVYNRVQGEVGFACHRCTWTVA